MLQLSRRPKNNSSLWLTALGVMVVIYCLCGMALADPPPVKSVTNAHDPMTACLQQAGITPDQVPNSPEQAQQLIAAYRTCRAANPDAATAQQSEAVNKCTAQQQNEVAAGSDPEAAFKNCLRTNGMKIPHSPDELQGSETADPNSATNQQITTCLAQAEAADAAKGIDDTTNVSARRAMLMQCANKAAPASAH